MAKKTTPATASASAAATSPAAARADSSATPAEGKLRRNVKLCEAGSPTFQAGKLKVDLAAGLCESVKICGLESKHGYPYTETALREAGESGMYERIDCYVDHPPEDGSGQARERPFRSKFGFFEGVHYRSGDGLWAKTFRFNPKHQLAEQFAWWADNAPDKIGFSQLAKGNVIEDASGNILRVDKITKAHSVDLVSFPATTKGLREGYGGDDESLNPNDLHSNLERADAAANGGEGDEDEPGYHEQLGQLIDAIVCDPNLTAAEKKSKILAAVKLLGDEDDEADGDKGKDGDYQNTSESYPSTEEERDMSDKNKSADATPAEEKKEKRPKTMAEAMSSLRSSNDPNVKLLVEAMDGFELKQAAAQKRERVAQLCEAAKLPAEARSAVFLDSLHDCGDEKVIQSRIEDRRALWLREARGSQQPISNGADAPKAPTLEDFQKNILDNDRLW